MCACVMWSIVNRRYFCPTPNRKTFLKDTLELHNYKWLIWITPRVPVFDNFYILLVIELLRSSRHKSNGTSLKTFEVNFIVHLEIKGPNLFARTLSSVFSLFLFISELLSGREFYHVFQNHERKNWKIVDTSFGSVLQCLQSFRKCVCS